MDLSAGNRENSYGRYAVKGGIWLFGLKAAHRLLGLARTVVLARLLSPDDFGLMGVAVLAISTLETFSKTGIEPALVQKKEDIRGHLDTAWTILVVRSLVLFALLYSGAPLIAVFFNSPQAVRVIRVLALLELFLAVKNIGVVYFQRELRFDKRFFLEFSGLAANIAVSITLAFTLRSVWALVWGSLAGAFCTMVVSYIIHPYRPRLKLEKEASIELIHFGKWIFISSILFFLVSQGDSAFVGKALGIAALGFYQMANRLSNMMAAEIRNMVFYVLFPVYSRIQHDVGRLKKAYVQVLHLNNFVSFPLSAGVFLFAYHFTRLFLGDKWLPMVPAMRVLAIAALIRSIGSTGNVLFYAIGKPRVETVWHGVRLCVMAVLIYPASLRWGISGTAGAVCAGAAVWAAGFMISLRNDIRLGISDIGRTLVFPAVNTAVMAAVVILGRYLTGTPDIAGFFLLFSAAVLSYLALNYLCVRLAGYGIYELIGERIKDAASNE